MANTSDIRGCTLIGTVRGGAHTARVRTYYVPSSDGTLLGVGDIVKLAGGTDTGGQYQAVTRAAASNVPLGFVVGVDPIKGVTVGSENLNRLHRPASTAMYLRVCDDPEAMFWMQENASGGAIPTSSAGQNANIVVANANTTSGYSQMQIASNLVATTNTLPLKLLGLLDRSDNATGTSAKWVCMFNVHQHKVDTGSAGV